MKNAQKAACRDGLARANFVTEDAKLKNVSRAMPLSKGQHCVMSVRWAFTPKVRCVRLVRRSARIDCALVTQVTVRLDAMMATMVTNVNGSVVQDVSTDYATQRQATVNVRKAFMETDVIEIVLFTAQLRVVSRSLMQRQDVKLVRPVAMETSAKINAAQIVARVVSTSMCIATRPQGLAMMDACTATMVQTALRAVVQDVLILVIGGLVHVKLVISVSMV